MGAPVKQDGSVGCGAGFEIRIQRLCGLIAIAEECQFHAPRPNISNLQRHALAEGPLDVQIPFFNIGCAVIE